jgi:uroporphyrinogen-III decarboxylase
MTAKERLLAAIRREDVDYAPCAPTFWSSPVEPGFEWRDEEERLEVCIERLGVDAVVHFGIPNGTSPQVRERAWEEHPTAELLPLIHKVIETPAGTLTATVRRTEDWPHGTDIPLMSDFVVSRVVKPWIETQADMDCFEQVWLPPSWTEAQAVEAIRPTRALADKWEVPISLPTGYGWTLALSLMGAEQAALLSADQPELLDRLAEIDHCVTMRKIELGLAAGVDILHRNGFYETTDFWSPAQIERHLLPRHRQQTALGHAVSVPTVYTVCTGIMPMLDLLHRSGFDCLYGIEPVLGNQDMRTVARELGPHHAIWGGLSAPIHIGQGSPDDVRRAVREFYEVNGRRGTILMATASIRPQWRWENVRAMVEEWKAERQ